jgi:hypothetical protein
MKPEIVPATRELMERFYGHPPRQTAQALVTLLGDEPIGVAGVYADRYGRMVCFADTRPVLRERFSKTGVRMAHRLMKMAREKGVTLWAAADSGIEPAARFLEYLGFTHVEKGVYICPALKS